ncbi:MAG: class I SAM-dependent methyltransferase [Acidobacteriota bacterium]|nr:class I SAM-dependent methyltransferase [Acidobacteriota bacterium]
MRNTDTNESVYQTGEYLEKNPTYHVEDSAWKADQILSMMRKHDLRPRTICEVGCGAGEILKQLQGRLPPDTRLFGYEISPQAIALCRERENEGLHFFCEDLVAAENKCFDLLLCLDVFEHVEDYLGFLRGLQNKGELKLFHIPLDLSVNWVWRRRPIMREREQAGHLHYFMKETAIATLRDAGYEVIDWCYTPGAIANPRSVKAKLASLPRRLLSAINQDLVVRMLGGYSLLVLAK